MSFFSQSFEQIIDGLLFGLGVLAVYLGAVFTGALVRSLGGAGSAGLTFAGRYVTGWFDYVRGDDRDTINVTLNMIVDNHLRFDTLVAERRIKDVWPNTYRMQMIRAAARRTTVDNPVILFPDSPETPHRLTLAARCRAAVIDLLASARIIENGKARRVRLMKEDDYRATYGPLISLVSEKASNDDSIDLAIGRPMNEYRFVIALTFEKLSNRRARHLRAMVMWENALLALPAECPRVDRDEHRTRFRTLQSIAAQYRVHPERFGVVHVWRPKELASEAAPALGARRQAAE